jgi:hypothetical protein
MGKLAIEEAREIVLRSGLQIFCSYPLPRLRWKHQVHYVFGIFNNVDFGVFGHINTEFLKDCFRFTF